MGNPTPNRSPNCCASIAAFGWRWHRRKSMASTTPASSRKSSGVQMESSGYSTVTRCAGSYFQFRKPGTRRTRVAIGACRIAAEGNGEQFERLLLTHEVEAFDPPKRLILAGRCRNNRGSAGAPAQMPEAQRAAHPHLRQYRGTSAGRKRCTLWCASGYLGEVDWRRHRYCCDHVGSRRRARPYTASPKPSQPHDPLHGSSSILPTKQDSYRLFQGKTTSEKAGGNLTHSGTSCEWERAGV